MIEEFPSILSISSLSPGNSDIINAIRVFSLFLSLSLFFFFQKDQALGICSNWNAGVDGKVTRIDWKKREGHPGQFLRFDTGNGKWSEGGSFGFIVQMGRSKENKSGSTLRFSHFHPNWPELIGAVLHAVWIIRNNSRDTVGDRFHWGCQRNRHHFIIALLDKFPTCFTDWSRYYEGTIVVRCLD